MGSAPFLLWGSGKVTRSSVKGNIPRAEHMVHLNAQDGLHAEGPSRRPRPGWTSPQPQREEGVGVVSPGAPGRARGTYLNKPLDSGRGVKNPSRAQPHRIGH